MLATEFSADAFRLESAMTASSCECTTRPCWRNPETRSVTAKCSKDTALRDITELLARDVLKKSEASGRSTSYELVARP